MEVLIVSEIIFIIQSKGNYFQAEMFKPHGNKSYTNRTNYSIDLFHDTVTATSLIKKNLGIN